MKTTGKLVHVLVDSPEEAAKLKTEMAGFEDQVSVIFHEKDTFKLRGKGREVLIVEHGVDSLIWLEAMVQTLAVYPGTQIILYSPLLAIPKGMARICPQANLYVARNASQAAALALNTDSIEGQERKTVLIVDDDNQVLKSFTRLLRGSPWNVYAVTHGERAMNLLGVEKVDLVVTDIKMPGIHGIELIARIRKEHKDLPIVVCSGYPGMKDDLELKFYNIAGFIEKPVNPEEFENQIAMALKS
ncbi:MAG: response regulator [Desulfatibacillum sp.]|nr:response regulator [Desulfatibacillum sp.]